MATTWSTTADYSFSQQDLWKAKVSGRAEDLADFKVVAEAPENMLLDPEDYDIVPEEIQADNEDWHTVSGQNVEPGDGWTLAFDGDIED